MVISYELGARVAGSASGIYEKGWTFDIRGGLSMPPSLGRLMGLNEEQIANAIGICASHSLPLAVLDCDREENTMTKNLRFGFVACDAVLACMLAKKGFTGPLRIAEGDKGWREVIFHGEMDLERLTDFSGWRILDVRHKTLCVNGTSHGPVLATLALVKEHDLKPEDIEAVHIKCGPREWRHTTTFAKKYPRNAESADHSPFYGSAIAIKERAVGPEQFEPEKFTDPVVLDLIERMTVEPDYSIPDGSFQGISEIITKDGRRFQKRVAIPHGFLNDPLTDAELEDKFRNMAKKYMGKRQIQKIFDTVWNLTELDDIGRLTALMVFP